MNRTLAGLAGLVLLGCSSAASARDKHPAALKRLMPPEQLALAERMEYLTEQHATLLSRIKDAKQRRVENEKLGAEVRRLQEALVNRLRTEGLNGWVGTCGVVAPGNVVMLNRFQAVVLYLELRGDEKPRTPTESAVHAIRVNEIVRFSTKPDPSYALPRATGKTFHGFGQNIKLDSITAVQRLGVAGPPAPKTPPVARKKR